jgi:dTMP kinase
MARGRFIVFEGVEGAGKTTQKELLARWLETHHIAHIATREPGGTPTGESVRALLLHGDALDVHSELLLLLAARAALVRDVVQPALAAGKVVVGDRYELSTFAYQIDGRGLPAEEVRRLNAFATGGLRPDLTIVLQVPALATVTRRAARPGGADRIEQAPAAFHARVAAGYQRLTMTEPAVEALDGTPAPDQVHQAVVRLLQERFPETFAGKKV